MTEQPSRMSAASRFSQQLAVIVLGLAAMAGAPAWSGTLAQALASPDHLLLMRHADAPGIGDPDGFALGNCATQRNLGERGRRQARATGTWLRAQGVIRVRVFSSPWCRSLDTANLLGFGPVLVEQSLGSFFNEPSTAGDSTRQLAVLVARELRTRGRDALILVTHQVNISAYVGTSVGSGDMVLARVDPEGRVMSYRLYPGPGR